MRFMKSQSCLIRNFKWAGTVILLFLAYASWATAENNTEYLLVTGFEPFQGAKTNGSWEAVQNLDGKHYGNTTVVVAQRFCRINSRLPDSAKLISIFLS